MARELVKIAVPDSLGKNYIINGDIHYWQRGTTFTNNLTADGFAQAWTADRFKNSVQRSGSNVGLSFSQQSDIPSDNNLSYSLRAASSYSTSFGATTAYGVPFHQRVEGIMVSELKPSQDVYLSFYMKCNFSGNIPIALAKLNSIGTLDEQSYMWNESVSANTWTRVYKKITLPADSIHYGTGTSFYIVIGACCGTTWSYYNASAAENTWNSGSTPPIRNSSSTNWMQTSGNWMQVTGLKLSNQPHNKFSLAANNLVEELRLCQRYYEKSYNLDTPPATATTDGALSKATFADTGGNHYYSIEFKTPKRTTGPTVTSYEVNGGKDSVNAISVAYTGTASTATAFASNNNVILRTWQFGASAAARLQMHFTAESEL